jgi:hypothetical protein
LCLKSRMRTTLVTIFFLVSTCAFAQINTALLKGKWKLAKLYSSDFAVDFEDQGAMASFYLKIAARDSSNANVDSLRIIKWIDSEKEGMSAFKSINLTFTKSRFVLKMPKQKKVVKGGYGYCGFTIEGLMLLCIDKDSKQEIVVKSVNEKKLVLLMYPKDNKDGALTKEFTFSK